MKRPFNLAKKGLQPKYEIIYRHVPQDNVNKTGYKIVQWDYV
jgi:hypothetical protein